MATNTMQYALTMCPFRWPEINIGMNTIHWIEYSLTCRTEAQANAHTYAYATWCNPYIHVYCIYVESIVLIHFVPFVLW